MRNLGSLGIIILKSAPISQVLCSARTAVPPSLGGGGGVLRSLAGPVVLSLFGHHSAQCSGVEQES